ncbi:MAG: hypothetical protein LBH18_02810 [Spirochaetaceae bacterium]|nr:hypothetical protein [Spirochaetaceae bacterium]
MRDGIIKRLLGSLRNAGDSTHDVRRRRNALRYRITDALICAFAVFFLYPSLLHFQRIMKAKWQRGNTETLFGVSKIPHDNKIPELMNGTDTGILSEVLMDKLRTYGWDGVLLAR